MLCNHPNLLGRAGNPTPSGSSPVGTSGITVTQVAYGDTTANTIKGDAAFTFTQATGVLKLGVSGSSANSVSITGDSSGGLTLAAAGTNQNITLTPSGTGQTRLSGNLLLAGLAVNGTGVLQFPAATTSAGGITFGTDVNIYRSATGELTLAGSTASAWSAAFRDSGSVVLTNSGGNGVLVLTDGTNNVTLSRNGNWVGTNGANSFNIRSNNTVAVTIDSSQNAQFTKLITSYNGIATVGNGVATVQGAGTIAGTVDSRSAAVATYTVGAADATFKVGGNVNVTASATHTFSLDVTYTDETNVARTLILPMAQLAGAFITGGLITAVTGTGPYESTSMIIRCKAATAITIRPSAGGTYTSVTYNAAATIVKLA